MKLPRFNRYSNEDSDLWLLNEAIDLCQEGQQFYSQATQGADDYNIQRVFRHMAEVRNTMLQRLTPLFRQAKPNYTRPRGYQYFRHKSLSQCYAEAEQAIEQRQLSRAISVLIITEQDALNRLKLAAKRANSQRVARQLAEGIAWLQISCDSMKSLQLNKSNQSL